MLGLGSKGDLEKLCVLEEKDGRYVGKDDGRGDLFHGMMRLDDGSCPANGGGYQSLVCHLCVGLLRLCH